MSQQRMDYDEGNRQQQEPRLDNYESGYRDPFTGTYTGQKLAQQGSAPAGMRLALALVSVVMLVPLTAITFGILGGGIFSGALIALVLICLTIMVVNIAFNYRR